MSIRPSRFWACSELLNFGEVQPRPLGQDDWPLLGEVPPDQQGRSDRQFPSDPAIGNIMGRARSWGPQDKQPHQLDQPKTLPTATLRMGLELLVSGGIFFPAEYSVQPGDRASHLPKLTRRQIQVLAGIANGQTTAAIARRVGISEPTVKLHLATSMRVLGVKTRVAAVLLAERLGLLE